MRHGSPRELLVVVGLESARGLLPRSSVHDTENTSHAVFDGKRGLSYPRRPGSMRPQLVQDQYCNQAQSWRETLTSVCSQPGLIQKAIMLGFS